MISIFRSWRARCARSCSEAPPLIVQAPIVMRRLQPDPSVAAAPRRAPRLTPLLLLVLAACGETTGSETPSRFRLVSVDGQPPATAEATGAIACDSAITGGSIDLGAGDRFSLTYDRGRGCDRDTTQTGLTAALRSGSRQTGIYEREGSRIRFYIGPAAADSAVEEPIVQGAWVGDTLQLRDERRAIDVRFVRTRSAGPVPN